MMEVVRKPFIEIESLEQLVELIKDTDSLVVEEDSIIIYDYYLE